MRPLAILALLLALPAPAHAQMVCGVRAEIVRTIGDKYREFPTDMGFAGNNLVELYKSQTGSFTILVTMANGGQTCILASGKEWQEIIPPSKMGEPS